MEETDLHLRAGGPHNPSSLRFLQILLLLFALLVAATDDAGKSKAGKNARSIKSVLSCLAAQDWVREDLRELGLREGDTATVRYGRGAIPGTSPADLQSVNVVVYSGNGRKAWLLLARVENGGVVVAVRNAYRLTHGRSGWTTSEGNGGLATYRAVARYVAALGKKPVLKLRLAPGTDRCRTEE